MTSFKSFAMSANGSSRARRRPGASALVGTLIVAMLPSPMATADPCGYLCRWVPSSAMRRSIVLHGAPDVAHSCSECGLASSVSEAGVEIQAIANDGAVRPGDGGVLEAISRWQACFTRERIQDVDAVVAACDVVASSPDLPEPTREWVARRRAMLLDFKARLQEKRRAGEGGAPSEKRF